MDKAFYEKLYEHEQSQRGGLKRCHKLTRSHIWPTAFEKMNVRKAAQLFSDSMTHALQHYRNLSSTALLFKGIFIRMSVDSNIGSFFVLHF